VNTSETTDAVNVTKLVENTGSTPPLFSVLSRSFGWAGGARAVSSVGNTARYWLFARMLTPYDFGVTTMALLTVDMLWAITSASFDKALVQQEEEIEPFLDTVWTTTLARGALIAVLLLVAARPIAGFFRQEEAYIVFWRSMHDRTFVGLLPENLGSVDVPDIIGMFEVELRG